jgi:pantothenate synthetase
VDPDTVSITFAGDTVVSNIFGRPVSFQINEDTGTYTWFEIQQAQLYCNQGITNLENPQRAVTLPAKTRP